MSGADCRTDDHVVHAKAYFVIKPMVTAKGVILPKRLNVGRIKDEIVKEKLRDILENIESTTGMISGIK